MSHPNGEGAQGGATDPQSGVVETNGTGTGTETNPDATAQSGGEVTATPETVARAEHDALRERMRAADQRAGRAEQELKQLRDKDMPEVEKLQRDFQESQKQVETLQSTNQSLALQVAFLKDNTYSWHNPETAMKLVDLSQVQIEADGTVSGLKDALKALATSNDYLVKKEATTETPKPPAGTAPGNNGSTGKTGGQTPTRASLAARFPALNTRVKRS